MISSLPLRAQAALEATISQALFQSSAWSFPDSATATRAPRRARGLKSIARVAFCFGSARDEINFYSLEPNRDRAAEPIVWDDLQRGVLDRHRKLGGEFGADLA